MIQKYNCVVTKVKKDGFSARVINLDEYIECSLKDVDPDEINLVKKGAQFVWFITRYNHHIISFSLPPFEIT